MSSDDAISNLAADVASAAIISPSSSILNVDDEAYLPQSYDEAFPALALQPPGEPVAPIGHGLGPAVGGQTFHQDVGQWNTKFALRPSKCTQVFSVPLEERRFKEENDMNFGDESEQAKICKDIMKNWGVSIEMSMAKDQSLTVVIHGKVEYVMKARRQVENQLQTQAVVTINIPRAHHRFILGKSGKKLNDLEAATNTKITIPRSDDNNDTIRITGTKEGIDRARHDLQCISDEQAKLASEKLNIPKIFHPFVCGPNNQIIRQLMEETGARINVPPLSIMKNEIIVSGEKEGVAKIKATMMAIYEEMAKKCTEVSVEVRKSQHKYVIGPKGSNIQDILAQTGVSIEVPPLDSGSGTITLRGEQDKLGPALTMVYSKANSMIFDEVPAPAWLHRFIIGRGGSKIRLIMQQYPKVHIDFNEDRAKITVEGPPDEVKPAVLALKANVDDLQARMTYAEIEIDQKFHKHIIGKNGINVTRIKNETGVSLQIPSDNLHSPIIRIEGSPEGVNKAKEELLEMALRMENERSRDIIIEQRFHRTIIGTKGEKVREIRDRYNQVQITFPDAGKKSNIVTLRGPKLEVDKCYKHMQQLHQDLIAANYQAEVKIFKQFHKNIIGKGGANIKKIRDETDTRIDLPAENSENDVITITGKKANVDQAKIKIEAIQKELANIKELTVEIPHRLHNSIIGTRGRLIRSIMDECGGVIIRFPPEGSNNDKVTIRGPKEDVENARRQLMDLASEKQLSSNTVEVRAKPEYHRFLIGRGGAVIRKVREKTGARIIFPADQNPDQDLITIIGKKEAVDEAKLEVELLIKELDNIVEITMSVDPKHHRHFVARRGEVLQQISDDFGGVTVSFPRSGTKSSSVTVKGPKECVEAAKNRIQELADELDAHVTVECIIAQKFHRTVMGMKGSRVQDITSRFNVGVKFPDRPTNDSFKPEGGDEGGASPPAAAPMVNGEPEENGDGDHTPKTDIIIITGLPENCEAAKEALISLVPVTVDVNVPFEFHRFIIGQKGRDVREMMNEFGVNISVPPANQQCDNIAVTGPLANVERAQVALQDKVDHLEKEKEDKLLKSFQLTVEVDPVYHSKIIGRRGAVVTKIRQEFDVNIRFPDEPNQNIITIIGYEKNTNDAKEAVLKIVRDLEDMTSLNCEIDCRLHARIIGSRGREIRKIMDNYRVDVRFPRSDAQNPDLVTIVGMEDAAFDCRDHLLNIAEEFMQDLSDRQYLTTLQTPPSRRDDGDPSSPPMQQGYVVKNAPWDKAAPDTSSTEEFPSFSGSYAPSAPSSRANQSWGPTRKF